MQRQPLINSWLAELPPALGDSDILGIRWLIPIDEWNIS
jgi:hypothetical protein